MLGSSFDWSVWPEWAAAVYRARVALPAKGDAAIGQEHETRGARDWLARVLANARAETPPGLERLHVWRSLSRRALSRQSRGW